MRASHVFKLYGRLAPTSLILASRYSLTEFCWCQRDLIHSITSSLTNFLFSSAIK